MRKPCLPGWPTSWNPAQSCFNHMHKLTRWAAMRQSDVRQPIAEEWRVGGNWAGDPRLPLQVCEIQDQLCVSAAVAESMDGGAEIAPS